MLFPLKSAICTNDELGMMIPPRPTFSEPILLRDPADLFPTPLPAAYSFLSRPPIQHRINIKHPAYSEEDNNLFSLYAWDHADGGLHYGLVYEACTIVAGNVRGGFFSTSRQGPAIESNKDSVLRAGNYYFHIPNPEADPAPIAESYRWPVVTCFQDWPFPPEVPAEWTVQYSQSTPYYTAQQSTVTSAVRARDVTCRITRHSTGTQAAHICPEHESEWFRQNSMSIYNTDLTLDPDNLLNDLSNVMLLRSDLHLALDDQKFTFYPKVTGKLVVHMLKPSPDLTQLYHNVQVQPPLQCHPSFLYARFAWAIFPLLAGFLSKPGVSRYLLLSRETSTGSNFVAEEIAKPEQLRAKVSASRSRSPKERHRAKDWDTQGDSNCCKSSQQNERIRRSATYMWPQPPAKDMHLHAAKREIYGREQMQPIRAHTAEEELEEDMKILNNRLSPAMVECLPAWYPGWRAVNRLKEQWIAKERSRNGVHITNNMADNSSIGSDMDTVHDTEDVTPDLIYE